MAEEEAIKEKIKIVKSTQSGKSVKLSNEKEKLKIL